MEDLPAKTAAIIKLGFMLVIAILLLSQAFGAATPVTTTASQDDVEIVNQQGRIDIPGDDSVQNVTAVTTSLNTEVALDGSPDAAVSLDTSLNLTENWETCTLARADDSVVSNNEQRAILSLNELIVYYNGTADTYAAWYYDDGSRASVEVAVAAPDPTNRTAVCIQRTPDTLTLFRNTSANKSVSLASGQADAPSPAPWDGELEEIRVWNRTNNASQRQAYVDQPALAVRGEPAAVRLMFDVWDRSRSSVPAYFADGDASLSGASLVTTGVSGPTISSGSDYTISGLNNRIISVPDGSLLTGDGDVLFTEFEQQQFGGLLNTAKRIFQAVFILVALGGLLMAGRYATEMFDM
jgi:hypothetical protein